MPQRDGTGPFGMGTVGRGAGGCAGNQSNTNWGRGRRFNRGGGMRLGGMQSVTPEDTMASLEQRKSWLEQQLEWINNQIKNMGEPK